MHPGTETKSRNRRGLGHPPAEDPSDERHGGPPVTRETGVPLGAGSEAAGTDEGFSLPVSQGARSTPGRRHWLGSTRRWREGLCPPLTEVAPRVGARPGGWSWDGVQRRPGCPGGRSGLPFLPDGILRAPGASRFHRAGALRQRRQHHPRPSSPVRPQNRTRPGQAGGEVPGCLYSSRTGQRPSLARRTPTPLGAPGQVAVDTSWGTRLGLRLDRNENTPT